MVWAAAPTRDSNEAFQNQALRTVGRRLVGILHACLRDRTTYDETTAWQHHQAEHAAAA